MDLLQPRSHRHDPATSRIAADEARKFAHGHIRIIVETLEGVHPFGLCAREISERSGLEYHAIQRRLKEAEIAGLVRRLGTKNWDGKTVTNWGAK